MRSKNRIDALLQEGVSTLKKGKVVVFPTDTAYGLGVDATNLQAVRKLYKVKGRDSKKPVHLVASSLSEAKKYAYFNQRAEKIFKKFMPGPLTMILPLKSQLASFRFLSAGTGTIGIRMPDNYFALELVRKLGHPITATSANVSGGKNTYSIEDVEKQFKKRELKPDLVIDAGRLKKVRPSTVIDLTRESVKILRQGPVSLDDILRAFRSKPWLR